MRWSFAIALVCALAVFGGTIASHGETARPEPHKVLHSWYKLMLELVRHTPTYSPPVASRSFAYLGITAFEAAASGSADLKSLAGQLNGFAAGPKRESGKAYDDAIVLQAAMAAAAENFFDHTGPTGHRALAALTAKLNIAVDAGVPEDVIGRSKALGEAIAAHVFNWSKGDGGATVENLGFPVDYKLTAGPAHWAPTSLIALQQLPLLPKWGENRPFAMPKGISCDLPPPPAYSEDKASEFYKQALEVFETKKALTPEQQAIARFWSDDPMLSPTPPGHWVSIALQILERENADLDKSAEDLYH